MSDTLSTLLNKVEALIASGFSSISKCATEIGERPQRVSEWVTQRAHKPSGMVAMKLHDWCAAQTIIDTGRNSHGIFWNLGRV